MPVAQKSTFATDNERVCLNRHRDGYRCTRRWQHPGDHHAHGDDPMVVLMSWRGGRSNWNTKGTTT